MKNAIHPASFARSALFLRGLAAPVIALAATAAHARSVAVSSSTDSALTLAFGDADGSSYTLAWGYGAADAGAATNAWDSFEILGTVAADATSQTVPLPANWGDSVKSLRFFLLEPETRPYAKRLEYIESTGTQWIDTQVRGKVGVETEMDVACVTMNDNTILGCRKDGGDTRFYPVHWANSKWWKGWLRGGVYWSTSPEITIGQKYHVRSVFKSGTQAFYVDGVSKGTPTTETSSFDSGINMYLFAANKYGTDVFQQAKARVYSAKIWLDGDLKRDFVPCKDENGVACLYDLVSGAYFRNGGSGTFAEGAEIPLGLVVSATSTAHNWVSSNTLVVEAGAPTSVMNGAAYDAVLLRDTLALRGGTLETPSVVVDGEAGCLDVNGGSLPSAARLSLSPDLATANEYATVLALRSGKTTLQCATNANAAVAARIHFLGGSLGCTSFSGTPLCSANGGKWILEGTATHPIRFGPLEMQRMSWLAGDGSIETRGPCDVEIVGSGYIPEQDYRSTVYFNAASAVWNHTGDLVLSNAVDAICRANDCLPSGTQTGGIVLKWINRAGPPAPRLDLNGRSVAVNGIDGSAGGVVTNSSSAVATLRIGEGDAAGSITNLVLRGGNVNLVKRGAETNVVAIGASDLASLRVEAGTLVVSGEAGMRLSAASVSVAEGATLVVARGIVTTGTFSGAGTVERVEGGALEITFGGDGAADTVVWDEPGIPDGNAFVKVGTNRAVVQTEAALGTDIDVRGGSLVFSGRTCTNEWYRFLFNGTQYGDHYQIAIGDLRVYSDTNKTENVAKGIGSGGKILAAGSNPANLEPGACVAHFSTASQAQLPSGQSANLWDLRNAFDDDNYAAVLSRDTYYLYNNASQTWVAFRMATGKNRVQCYLPAKASGITWYWHPSAWLFQTSPDGVNWQTVDVRNGAISESGYGSTPFLIKGFLADGAAGFDPAANVKVAAGATLDARGVAGGQTLSRLTIDMTAGAGTIRGVSIAPNGVLDLVNVPPGLSLHDVSIPVTLLDVTGGRNFASWTILVEGAPARTGYPSWQSPSIRLYDGGSFLILK